MVSVREEVLRRGTIDFVSMREVANAVVACGVADEAEVRAIAEGVVHDLVLGGMAVLGYPDSSRGGFATWPGTPEETLDHLAQEWRAAESSYDPFNWIGWLSLTPSGDRAGRQLIAEDEARESGITNELGRRWPLLVGALDLQAPSDRARFTLGTLADEVASGQAPPFRKPLAPDIQHAVFAAIDELYDTSDDATRDVIYDRVALGPSYTLLRDNINRLLLVMGPSLRRRLEAQVGVWAKLGMLPP